MPFTSVQVIDINDLHASQAEIALDEAHFPLPLPSRVSWGRHSSASVYKLAVAEDADGHFIAAIGLELMRTRALPGHYILRMRAFGDAYATPAGEALLGEIARYAAQHGRVLRVVVEIECRAEPLREIMHRTLAALAFREVPATRIPARTLAIDLVQGEEKILASFNSSTRRKIRQASMRGLEIVPITEPVYSGRMNELLAETFARTGGQAPVVEWAAIMAICRELPHRSRLIGVFLGPGRAPQELLAYGWGIHHGERAVYGTGASTRVPHMQLSLLYPVMWDLIVWAKREGATWFDLGGITPGTKESDDPRGGISDFKRGFSREAIAIGEEWVYEPSTIKARVAGLVSTAVDRFRAASRRFPISLHPRSRS